MTRKISISVIGGGDITTDEALIAEEVGKEIALNNATLICGGLGGVMYYAAKGAKEHGGLTIGILPGNAPDDCNDFIDVPIVTGLGHARNVIVASSGDAVIAIGGKLGTLSEISFALIQNKPVIGINTWNIDFKSKGCNGIILAKDAKDAVKKALKVISK